MWFWLSLPFMLCAPLSSTRWILRIEEEKTCYENVFKVYLQKEKTRKNAIVIHTVL